MIEAVFSGVLAAAISTVGAVFAHRSAKNTKPISNGFAEGVREDLREVRQLLQQHLRDHHRGQ